MFPKLLTQAIDYERISIGLVSRQGQSHTNHMVVDFVNEM